MHPLLAREPALLQGAFQGAEPATPPPAEVFFGTTFATATPDTAAGGNLVSAGFTLRRSGDLAQVVTVSVKVAGAAPTPLVAADVQGGLSDVQYRFDPGVAALSLQVAFLAQDLDADHFGEVSLHAATGAAILGGVFDFALVHNHVVVVVPPPGTYDLAPDWTVRWVMHTTALATIQQLALGVAARAGAVVTDDGSWVIVSKHVHSAPAAVGAGAAAAPLSGWATAAALLPSGDPNYVAIRRAADFPATFAAGKQYVVQNAIDLGGRTIAVAGGGSAGHESHLRGVTAGRDPTAYPRLSNGALSVSSSSTIVRELGLDACPIVLAAGCSRLQIESNWFSGIDNNEADGFVQHDGTQNVSWVLLAFNLCRKRAGQISAPLLRAKSDKNVVGRSALTHVRAYRNHYDGIREHAGGYTNVYFLGNNDEDEFKDMDFESRDELATDWGTADPWGEFKYAGCRIVHPTIEFSANTPAGSGGGAVRLRHGRVSSDDTLAAGVGKGQVIDGVLYVWPTAKAGKTVAVECQDGFFTCVNCQGIVTDAAADAPGGQPHAGMTEGPLEIWLYQGVFRWEDYVAQAPRYPGTKWPSAGKCLVGGNHGTVKVGQPRTGTTVYPDYCRVAPITAARADRNKGVTILKEDATHPTDLTTPVPGAAYDTYLHRLAPAEVGCAGWDASYYGAAAVSRPGADDALWNVPLARWTVHPSSATLVSRLWNDGFDTPGNVNLSTGGGIGIPRFETDGSRGNPAATTTIQVSYTDHGHAGWSNMAEGDTVPWNPLWRPSGGFWAGDASDDAELCIINPGTGEAWDLWQVELLAGKLQVGAAHKNVGDWRTTSIVAAGDAGSRGSGIPYVQMITLSGEVGAGLVPHAMAMPSRAEAVPAAAIPFVAPAQKTDGDPGLGAASNPGVPSGTRFGLVCTDADVAAWRAGLPATLGATAIRALATIVQALRDYGWHVTDHAGSGHLQLGSDESEHWANLGLQTQTIAGKVYPRDALDGLLTQGRLQAFAPPAPAGGDFDASFYYTHRQSPAVTDAQGCASLFYCEMVGQGAYPADVSAWSPAQWGHASDVEYQPNANWVRFTFGTFNTVTPALSAKLRLVVCAGGVITRPNPNEAAATWNPAGGVRYAMRCRKSGNDFQIWATDPRDGSVVTQSWTDATAGGMDHGNFLFRLQPGRWADIESFQLN